MGAVFLSVLIVLYITSPIRPDSAAPQIPRVTIITVVITRLVTVTPVPTGVANTPWPPSLAYSPLMIPTQQLPLLAGPNKSSGAASSNPNLTPQIISSSLPSSSFNVLPTPIPKALFVQEESYAPYPFEAPPESPPLSEVSSPREIAAAIRFSEYSYTTLWLDVIVTLHSQPGYGPGTQYRYQVWSSRNQALVLAGPPEGPPAETWVAKDDRLLYFARDFSPMELSGSGWMKPDSYKRPLIGGLDLLFDPFLLGNHSSTSNNLTITIPGLPDQANRPSLVVDEINNLGERSSRLWIDKETGLVLRNMQFQPGSQQADVDIAVKEIAYNDAFTNLALFDLDSPWKGGFASGVDGLPAASASPTPFIAQPDDPLLLMHKTPPPGFDPAHSRLYFRYPPDIDPTGDMGLVNLYGDDYYLGEMMLGNPWYTLCTRSPDGSKLAVSSKPLLSPSSNTSYIYWYDLTSLPATVHGPVAINPDEMAFAPDSRHLAVIGNLTGSSRGVYVADLQDNSARLLREMDALSLVWRHDGRLLAMISMENKNALQLIILNPDTGEVVYRSPYSPFVRTDQFEISSRWKVNFPAAIGHLEACITPPQK